MAYVMDHADDLAKDDGYWYLATPYSKWQGGLDDAFVEACKFAGMLVRRRVPVFSPIAHSHPIARYADIDPYSHDIWIPADRPFWAPSKGLLVADLPGWRDSKGVAIEVDWFLSEGKPVFLIDEVLNLTSWANVRG